MSDSVDEKALIDLQGVGLKFRRYSDAIPSLKQTLINRVRGARRASAEDYWLYRDLSLRIDSGESVGIIGANGAGKSTLLKLLAGIYPPTLGTVWVRGGVASLIEIGTGLNVELTGVENVRLMGALMGKSDEMMIRRTQAILDFAGLEEFAQMPVKYYSAGMTMRLAFSVATDVEPEILLLDEVFAAGDEEFVSKATSRMQSLVESAHIVVMVSHSMPLIRSSTHRVLWVDGGCVMKDGDPDEVCDAYLSFEHAKLSAGGDGAT